MLRLIDAQLLKLGQIAKGVQTDSDLPMIQGCTLEAGEPLQPEQVVRLKRCLLEHDASDF